MEEEQIEVLDEIGHKTGIIKNKSDIKKNGDFHQAISVIVINNNNEVIIHKRSSNKKVYPNLWSIFIRGHVHAHESNIGACIRELYEEIGIKVEKENLIHLYTRKETDNNKNYINNLFYDNYLLRIRNKEVKYNDEISEIKFIKIDDLKNSIIENKDVKDVFVPNKEDYDIIFEKINQYIGG